MSQAAGQTSRRPAPLLLLLFGLLSTGAGAQAESAPPAVAAVEEGGAGVGALLAYCEKAERNLNALVEVTETRCSALQPAAGRPASFLFVATGSVMESEGRRRDWLLPLVTVTGFLLNSGTLEVDRILLTDAKLAARSRAFSLPAQSVRRLQRALADRTLDVETMYARILAELDVERLK